MFGQHSLFISMKKSWKNSGKVLLATMFIYANLLESYSVKCQTLNLTSMTIFGRQVCRDDAGVVHVYFMFSTIISFADPGGLSL